jgi:prepilin peptidase CpaA
MNSIAWWPTVAVLTVATATDLRSRRIPNWLVLPFLVIGIAVDGWRQGWYGIGQSFAGIGVGALVYGFCAWKGGMGMGDVKLVASIGAWVGPRQLFLAMLISGMAGGLMILCWAASRFVRSRLRSLSNSTAGEESQPNFSLNELLASKMPYAPAIAIGTLFSFFAFPGH